MAFLCSICHQFASPTFGGVLRHVGSVHAFEYNFSVRFGISGCEAHFKKFSSWRSHIYRKYRQELDDKSDDQQAVFSTICTVCSLLNSGQGVEPELSPYVCHHTPTCVSGHPLFSVHECGLQVMLYYDDVEVCNPLGSAATVHKLGTHTGMIISIRTTLILHYLIDRALLLYTW